MTQKFIRDVIISTLISFTPISVSLLDATVVRMTIAESKDLPKNRVIQYGDIHVSGSPLLIKKQKEKLVESYIAATNKGSTALFVEAVSPGFTELNTALRKLIFNATQHLDSLEHLSYPEPLQSELMNLRDALQGPKSHGDFTTHFLITIADAFDASIKSSIVYVDDRNIIFSIHDVLCIIALLPLCKDTPFYNSVVSDLSEITLSEERYRTILKDFLSRVSERARTTKLLMKNRENKTAINEFIDYVGKVKQLVEELAKKNDLATNFFKEFHQHSESTFNYVLPLFKKKDHVFGHDSYLEAVLGSHFWALIESLSPSLTLSDWFSDVFVLADILSPQASGYSFVAAGDEHGQKINKILERENYSLLYDSLIRLKDGRSVKSLEDAIGFLPQVVVTRTAEDMKAIYQKILPLEDKIYYYALARARELKTITHQIDEL